MPRCHNQGVVRGVRGAWAPYYLEGPQTKTFTDRGKNIPSVLTVTCSGIEIKNEHMLPLNPLSHECVGLYINSVWVCTLTLCGFVH